MSSFVASGPGPVHTAEGFTLAAGESRTDIDPTDPHNARLIEGGRLVRVRESKPPTKTELLEQAKALDIEGRSSMTADELRTAIENASNQGDK